MKYVIVNLEDIPDDLPPGKYHTQIVSASWDKIELKYIGPENPDNPCLLPLIKVDPNEKNLRIQSESN